jgi:predicted DNA-binding transcriptional regulator AlpA
LDRYLRTREAASYCGVSPRTLEKLRLTGGGPRFCRPSGRRIVVYAQGDLDAWLKEGRRWSTSEQNASRMGTDGEGSSS